MKMQVAVCLPKRAARTHGRSFMFTLVLVGLAGCSRHCQCEQGNVLWHGCLWIQGSLRFAREFEGPNTRHIVGGFNGEESMPALPTSWLRYWHL